jgi:hypothetical protein
MRIDPIGLSAWVLFAALLPIIIHMLNRLRYKTVQWAAMIFLLKANKAATRRAKLKQYLLLLFRALLILFMVWAMLRPKMGGWVGATAGGSVECVVIVLDRSSSMEARTSPDNPESKRRHALKMLAEAAKEAKGSRFVLIENVLRQPLEMADAASLANMQMAEATDTAADVPAMLRVACDYLVKNRVGSSEIWLASDLQKSNWRDESPEWRDINSRLTALSDTRLVVLDLSSTPASNLSIAMKSAEFRPARTPGPDPNVVRGTLAMGMEVRSMGATGTFPLRMTRDGATSQGDLVLNSQVRRESMKFDVPKLPEGGGWGKVELPADDVLSDNVAYYSYRLPVPLHAAVVSDLPAAKLFAAAAAPDKTRTDRTAEIVSPLRAGDIKWKDASLIIWQGPAPSEAVSKQLQAFVESGGVLLVFPVGGEAGNGPLGITWSSTENTKEPFRITTWDDLDGPIAKTDNGSSLPLARLETMRRQVPAMVSVSRHVYATFADGRPFLIGDRLGAGHVLACATSPETEWSTLGDGFVLLPMVQRLLVQGGSRLAPPSLAVAGDWKPVDGDTWTSIETDRRHDPRWHAGVYKSAGRLIALNRPESEDVLDLVEAPSISKQLLPSVKNLKVVSNALEQDPSRMESDIWPAMIILTMIFMCLEMLLAMSKSLLPAKPKPRVPVPAADETKKKEGIGV